MDCTDCIFKLFDLPYFYDYITVTIAFNHERVPVICAPCVWVHSCVRACVGLLTNKHASEMLHESVTLLPFMHGISFVERTHVAMLHGNVIWRLLSFLICTLLSSCFCYIHFVSVWFSFLSLWTLRRVSFAGISCWLVGYRSNCNDRPTCMEATKCYTVSGFSFYAFCRSNTIIRGRLLCVGKPLGFRSHDSNCEHWNHRVRTTGPHNIRVSRIRGQ